MSDIQDNVKVFGVSKGEWIKAFVGIAFAFLTLYISREIAPLKYAIDDLQEWRKNADHRLNQHEVEKSAHFAGDSMQDQKLRHMEQDIKNLVTKREIEMLKERIKEYILELKEDIKEIRNGTP